ncbi:MAG: Probable aspartoacylase (EC [uncultured Sulfurovum sp.]|uniref:Probable aspartoacylase (EC) n=1 Tax=uncultured Sulfurovum sp. TaxID=269237 RepID=A0A6S6SG27_9BACT|nr:MAG: Probable aspartoacylase (EC [uncultured Sulfurovum sp.]
MIKKLAITGGTHGNELTGVYLVKKWKKNPKLIERSSFETVTELMNKQAIKEVRRYVDQDLNRSFSLSDLSNDELENHEAKLAKELNEKLGKKGSDEVKVDFIVDLHTTTANMGLSIVVSNESATTWRSIAYLCEMEPELKVYKWKGDIENAFVDSMAPHGFAIEVGAVPQGVLRADLFLKTEALVYHLLDYVEKENSAKPLELPHELEVYEHEVLVDYPRDEVGDIVAMVHKERQDQDFTTIKQGDPLFLTLDNETIVYEGEPRYTLFVNEAAYYEKGFAMTLAQKIRVTIENRK